MTLPTWFWARMISVSADKLTLLFRNSCKKITSMNYLLLSHTLQFLNRTTTCGRSLFKLLIFFFYVLFSFLLFFYLIFNFFFFFFFFAKQLPISSLELPVLWKWTSFKPWKLIYLLKKSFDSMEVISLGWKGFKFYLNFLQVKMKWNLPKFNKKTFFLIIINTTIQ